MGSGTILFMDVGRAPQEDWSAPRRALFRFGFAYFLLYLFPFPIGALPGTIGLDDAYNALWHRPAQLFATWVLRIPGPLAVVDNGSGDKLVDWCELAVRLALALLIAAVWSIATGAREHRKLHAWLRVYVRYALGAALLGYGWVKIFKSQFPALQVTRLLQPYGESSPMGLLWTFMGFSAAYNVFAGLGEVVPGVLLFFRRTTTLGALLAAAVMAQVVMLNFAFDVPVKIYSVHLLAMATFLGIPDGRRLLRVFVLNQPVPSADLGPPLPSPGWRWGPGVVKAALLLGLHWAAVGEAVKTWRTRGDGSPRHPLVGVWLVEEQVRAGVSLPPLVSDKYRLRSVALFARDNKLSFARLTALDGQLRNLGLKQDEATQAWTLSSMGQPVAALSPQQPDADHLVLQGTLDGDQAMLRLKRLDASSFLLVNRGFHWVNEAPFNR